MILFTWVWLSSQVWGFLPVLTFPIFTWKNGRLRCGTRVEKGCSVVPHLDSWSVLLLLLPNICSDCSCPGWVSSSLHHQGDLFARVNTVELRRAGIWVQLSQKLICPLPSQSKSVLRLFSLPKLCTWSQIPFSLQSVSLCDVFICIQLTWLASPLLWTIARSHQWSFSILRLFCISFA